MNEENLFSYKVLAKKKKVIKKNDSPLDDEMDERERSGGSNFETNVWEKERKPEKK